MLFFPTSFIDFSYPSPYGAFCFYREITAIGSFRNVRRRYAAFFLSGSSALTNGTITGGSSDLKFELNRALHLDKI